MTAIQGLAEFRMRALAAAGVSRLADGARRRGVEEDLIRLYCT